MGRGYELATSAGQRVDGTDDDSGEQPYDEIADYVWTERAFDLLLNGRLRGTAFATDGVLSSHVWGSCPRCGHTLDDRQVHTVIVYGPGRRSGIGGRTAPPEVLAVDVLCGCRHVHSRAPEGATGCGVSFRVELVCRVTP